MDEEMKIIIEQMKQLEPIDRCTNLSLIFIGETLSLLFNAGDQKRMIAFKQSIDRLFDEAGKAILNKSANAN